MKFGLEPAINTKIKMADDNPRKFKHKQLFSWVSYCQVLKQFNLKSRLFSCRDDCLSTFRFQGANSHGQLCLGHKEDVLLPKSCGEDRLPGNVEISLINGGGGHTAAITGLKNHLLV